MNNGTLNDEQKERLQNLRAEYNAIGQLVGPTSVIRFATLTAFFAFNAVLLSASGASSSNRLFVVAIAGVIGNLLLTLLELRTINAHTALIKRGRELEKALSITGGIYTRQRNRSRWPWGHGNVLISSYILALIGWLLVIAYCVGWLRGSLAAISGS